MKFTVLWKPLAQQQLAQLWISATDRQAVTRASYRIDQLLTNDPEQQGESRPHDRRILLERPLGVIFKVEPDDLVVNVLAVWSY